MPFRNMFRCGLVIAILTLPPAAGCRRPYKVDIARLPALTLLHVT